jgi:hypothetical protein
MHKPSLDEYKSMENFVDNEKPLVPKESGFVYQKEDLVTLASIRERREISVLQGPVERILARMNSTFIEVCQMTCRTVPN